MVKKLRVVSTGVAAVATALVCASRYVAAEGGTGKEGVKMSDEGVVKEGASCKFDAEELKGKLTQEQFRITQQNGTEAPFRNEYWDNHRAGIYVDVVSGQALFSSTDKFDSGTGWPSFTQPIDDAALQEKSDRSYGMTRTEVRSTGANSHLGHLFHDGPSPAGTRYCINSAALRFIPVEELEAEGYGKYKALFQSDAKK